jgi:hypothetical protein
MGLDDGRCYRHGNAQLLCATGRAADRLVLRSHPAVQACRRLGLAATSSARR